LEGVIEVRRMLLVLLAMVVTALSSATPSIGFGASDISWSDIQRSLATTTERARQDVSEDFTAVQRQAVESLERMGWTESEASTIVAGQERGGPTATAVGRAAGRDYAAYGASGGGMAARSDVGPRGLN
jgi:hypothetical protein